MKLASCVHASVPRLCAAAAALLISSGCIGQKAQLKAVHEGIVSTPGVVIWDKESAFRFEPGKPFQTPFLADSCVRGGKAGDYRAARERGARPVVVRVPGADTPLYGLLALCRVPSPATGPSSRSFDIRVPEEKLAETEGGLASLVHEYTNYADYPLWQLWLMRTPGVWR